MKLNNQHNESILREKLSQLLHAKELLRAHLPNATRALRRVSQESLQQVQEQQRPQNSLRIEAISLRRSQKGLH